MNEPDNMVISAADFQRLTTPEQAANFVQHKIQTWVDWTMKAPGPITNELTSRAYRTWHNRALIAYGEIVGAMQALYAVGKLSEQQFKDLKKRVIAATCRKAAEVQIG